MVIRESGELSDGYKIIIDKGGNSLSLGQFKDFGYNEDDPIADAAAASAEEKSFIRCQEIFKRDYGCCLKELFNLAGIPCEWA